MGLQAIETEYKGYRFRSRTEFRWAYLLDLLGVEWQYEPEGYDTGKYKYIPDFYLPERKLHVEIKTVNDDRVETDMDMWRDFREKASCPLVVMVGQPFAGEFGAIIFRRNAGGEIETIHFPEAELIPYKSVLFLAQRDLTGYITFPISRTQLELLDVRDAMKIVQAWRYDKHIG